MPLLQVFRHAKSDWSAGQPDHERPLNKRGQRAAALMGRYQAAVKGVPDLVISSSAVRARTTAERAIEAGGWGSELRIEPDLYQADAADVLRLVSGLRADIGVAMLVGHEPTMSGLVSRLIGEARVRFPTAALATIELEDWDRVAPGEGTLRSFVLPRDLEHLEG